MAAMMGGGGGNPMAAMMGGGVPDSPKESRTGESGAKVELEELQQAHEIDKAQEELRLAHEVDKEQEELQLAHEVDKELESDELEPEENTDEAEDSENPYETTYWKSRVMDVANHTGADYEDSESMLVAIEDFIESPDRIVSVQNGLSEEEYADEYGDDYDISDAEGKLLGYDPA